MPKRKADMNLRMPLVVILGATGSGKTKLSLELAKKFGGEIIGADSMQVYKALDIITAKATVAERNVAKHHLIDILEPHETYTVVQYRNTALNVIKTLFAEKKLPIVVGGTNYYIESLLWNILIEPPADVKELKPSTDGEGVSNLDLHEKLKCLDPEMADRLHPNNRRKILRSLEVMEQKGRKHSDIITEQQFSEGGSILGGGLRYPESVILWLQCAQNVLDARLDARVDRMINEGLAEELTAFHHVYNLSRLDTNNELDYSKGIFQSIGFKEFHNYLMVEKENRKSDAAKKLLEKGIEDLKIATRRYARKQKRWITNRFLGRNDRKVPPVFGLSTDDVTKWDENVLFPAVTIIESFMYDKPHGYENLPCCDNESNPNSQDKTFQCDTCQRVFVGDFQWQTHLKSRRHKRVLQSKKSKIARLSNFDDRSK